MTYRTKQEELTVITKTYDLILWSCNHTGKFPRNHRFVLGERIARNLYDLLVTPFPQLPRSVPECKVQVVVPCRAGLCPDRPNTKPARQVW